MNKKLRFNPFVSAILASTGAAISVDTRTLPQKGWKVHSGHAKVAGEEVHSMQSHEIDGTKNIVIKGKSGVQLSVTKGEAEVFAADYLTGLGYKIEAPIGAGKHS